MQWQFSGVGTEQKHSTIVPTCSKRPWSTWPMISQMSLLFLPAGAPDCVSSILAVGDLPSDSHCEANLEPAATAHGIAS